MKNLIKKLILASVPLYLSIGNAAATGCGGRFEPCEVPEPGTPYLILAALGVAVAVAKFRKKK